MRRRDLIVGLSAAALSPRGARAQSRIPRVGVLLYNTARDPAVEALKRGLAEAGLVIGRNIAVEYRFAERKPGRLPGLARELVELKPDIIVAVGGDVAPFAQAATKEIPIVFAISSDPVKSGLAVSLRRPGGNATGVTFLSDDLAPKRLELFKEVAPTIRSVAFFSNPEHLDNEFEGAERSARALSVAIKRFEARTADELPAAFQSAVESGFDSMYVVSSRHTVANVPAFVEFARKQNVPLVGGWGAWAKAGALLSYGPDVDEMIARAGGFIEKVLGGAKPADLPIEQPTKFDLIVNLQAAKSLGLKIPESFLLRADEVIE